MKRASMVEVEMETSPTPLQHAITYTWWSVLYAVTAVWKSAGLVKTFLI